MSGTTYIDEARFVKRRFCALTATAVFVKGQDARAALADRWRGLQRHAMTVAGDRAARWQLVTTHDPAPWFGSPTTLVFADRDRADPDALLALEAALDASGPHQNDDAWLEVDPRDTALIGALRRRGWHIDSIINAGSLATARARLDTVLPQSPGATARWVPMGLDDIPAVIDLHRATFSDHPEWCWFGAYPAHLARMEAGMREALEAPTDTTVNWVVPGPHGAIGHISLDIDPEPFWGVAAGLGVVLGPEARGQGLLKEGYRRAVVVARAEGATVWKGGTSQPAVLALTARLGRTWHQVGMRRCGRGLGPAHFERFEALSVAEAGAFPRYSGPRSS